MVDGTSKWAIDSINGFASQIDEWTSDMKLSLTIDNSDDEIAMVDYGRAAETYRLKIDLGL